MLRLHCRCGKKLKLAPELLGKSAACPNCGKRVRVVAGHADPDGDRIAGLFVVEKGPARIGEQVFLGGKQAIEAGMADGAHLRLQGKSVRGRHARIIPSPYGWRVEESDADGPVLINGRRIRGHNLLDGDLVQLGDFALRYLSDYTSNASRKLLKLEAEAAAEQHPGRVDRLATQEEALMAGVADSSSIAPLAADSSANQFAAFPVAEDAAPRYAAPTAKDDDLFVFASDDAAVAAVAKRATPTPARAESGPSSGVGEVICPSCGKALGKRARICVTCGINVITGRPLITAALTDNEELYERAQTIINAVSVIVRLWIFPPIPIASDAFGTHKPRALRIIFALNILISGIFLGLVYSGSTSIRGWRDLLLWAGDAPLPADELVADYHQSPFGDAYAFEQARSRIVKEQPGIDEDAAIIKAHESMRPDQQPVGRFRLYQLLTNTFLHGGVFHLAGNMLFLFVFGKGVNALIGDLWTAVSYLLLAIASSAFQAISMQGHPPGACVGASGAIMGLAGMYLILFPVNRVHMAIWWRWRLTRASIKIFSLRGFWVVLAYIALDVLATVLGAEDGVGHWAHMGGFAAGVVLAIFLLVARMIDARGGDIFSAVLGRRAWGIIGKPGARANEA